MQIVFSKMPLMFPNSSQIINLILEVNSIVQSFVFTKDIQMRSYWETLPLQLWMTKLGVGHTGLCWS